MKKKRRKLLNRKNAAGVALFAIFIFMMIYYNVQYPPTDVLPSDTGEVVVVYGGGSGYDADYVNIGGDTMTGKLNIKNNFNVTGNFTMADRTVIWSNGTMESYKYVRKTGDVMTGDLNISGTGFVNISSGGTINMSNNLTVRGNYILLGSVAYSDSYLCYYKYNGITGNNYDECFYYDSGNSAFRLNRLYLDGDLDSEGSLAFKKDIYAWSEDTGYTSRFALGYPGSGVFGESPFYATGEGDVYFNGTLNISSILYFHPNGTLDIDGNMVITGDINVSGQIYFNYSQELEVPVSKFKLPGVNPPGEDIIGVFPVLSFDKAQNESIYSTMHVIPDYIQGSDWYMAFYWAPDDGDTGDVEWCVELIGLTRDSNEWLNSTTSTYCVIDTAQGDTYELLKTAKIAIPGGGVLHDDQFGFRIFRGADDPADTYDNDAHLTEATIYYNMYRIGE